jgi:hypothetical protein
MKSRPNLRLKQLPNQELVTGQINWQEGLKPACKKGLKLADKKSFKFYVCQVSAPSPSINPRLPHPPTNTQMFKPDKPRFLTGMAALYIYPGL